MSESKAPDISVMAHVTESTKIRITETGHDGVWFAIEGDSYPSVAIHMSAEKLAEVRDAIVAYLDATS